MDIYTTVPYYIENVYFRMEFLITRFMVFQNMVLSVSCMIYIFKWNGWVVKLSLTMPILRILERNGNNVWELMSSISLAFRR